MLPPDAGGRAQLLRWSNLGDQSTPQGGINSHPEPIVRPTLAPEQRRDCAAQIRGDATGASSRFPSSAKGNGTTSTQDFVNGSAGTAASLVVCRHSAWQQPPHHGSLGPASSQETTQGLHRWGIVDPATAHQVPRHQQPEHHGNTLVALSSCF
ncbi:hypothetical protein EOD39_9441 [Acipenser ruthenus]|uniref:Uncharacterized protein n=1 Tax=Acipenser ruthenus TaxID=7906 RepID=A0A444U0N2_ACIRT|nr:hypothetical protein EOD39_9441 [Acipenser ruthenus]